MIVRPEHVEFAVVQRLRELLKQSHEPYEVTAAYAFFTAILCWTAQRFRTKTSEDASPAAQAAREVWDTLKRERIQDRPWAIAVDASEDAPVPIRAPWNRASASFADHTAERFIENLRNAVAHGDARTIRPFHHGREGRAEQTLVGFRFQCEERDRRTKGVTWSGDVVLSAADMQRIADEIAARFCNALDGSDPQFRDDVRKGVVEAA